jgi:PAS domain-containing protein
LGGVEILRDVIPPTTQDKDIRQKNVSSSKTSLEKLNSQTLSSILENLSQLFYIVDAKWNLIYINKRGANQAYLKPEKPGKNFWQRFPEVSGTEYERRLREAMDKKLNGSFEWKKPDGKWMDIKIFVLDNGLSVYVQDITRCKQMQEKIENQAKEHEKLIT